jgi:hypothetical protein
MKQQNNQLSLIYKRLDPEKLVVDLGLENVKVGPRFINSFCPFPENHTDGRVSRNFGISLDGNLVCFCFVCGKISLVKLVMKCKNLPYPKAMDWLFEHATGSPIRNKTEYKAPEFKIKDYQLEAVRGNISKYVIEERGISLEVYKKFKLGYDTKKKTIYFPVYNFDKKLIGLIIRKSDQKFYQMVSGFSKSLWLYGLGEAKLNTQVIISEGIFDILRGQTFGYNCIGTFGASLSDEQADLIINNFTSVVYIKHSDFAGQKARDLAYELLHNHIPFYSVKGMKNLKDMGEYSKRQMERVLATKNIYFGKKLH